MFIKEWWVINSSKVLKYHEIIIPHNKCKMNQYKKILVLNIIFFFIICDKYYYELH